METLHCTRNVFRIRKEKASKTKQLWRLWRFTCIVYVFINFENHLKAQASIFEACGPRDQQPRNPWVILRISNPSRQRVTDYNLHFTVVVYRLSFENRDQHRLLYETWPKHNDVKIYAAVIIRIYIALGTQQQNYTSVVCCNDYSNLNYFQDRSRSCKGHCYAGEQSGFESTIDFFGL